MGKLTEIYTILITAVSSQVVIPDFIQKVVLSYKYRAGETSHNSNGLKSSLAVELFPICASLPVSLSF